MQILTIYLKSSHSLIFLPAADVGALRDTLLLSPQDIQCTFKIKFSESENLHQFNSCFHGYSPNLHWCCSPLTCLYSLWVQSLVCWETHYCSLHHRFQPRLRQNVLWEKSLKVLQRITVVHTFFLDSWTCNNSIYQWPQASISSCSCPDYQSVHTCNFQSLQLWLWTDKV